MTSAQFDLTGLGRTGIMRGLNSTGFLKENRMEALIEARMASPRFFSHFERFLQLPTVNADQTGEFVTITVEYTAASIDKRFFICPAGGCIVTAVRLIPDTVASSGPTTVLIEKLANADNLTAGDDIITAGLNLVGTVDTVQTATNGSLAVRTMTVGESLALDFTGTMTSAVGVVSVDITLTAAAGLPRAANPNIELQGTNASDDDATFLEGGGIRIETDGAGADQAIIAAHIDASQSALAGINWDSANEPMCVFEIVTGPQVGDVHNNSIFAGFKLTNTDVLGTDADQFMFRAPNTASPSTWRAVTSVNGTDEEFDTSTTLVEATSYQLAVILDASRSPHYYLNGNFVHIGPVVRALSTFDFYVGIADRVGGGAAVQLDIRNLFISQLYG